MTPERWQQIRELLHSAMQIPVAERSAFLDSKCSDDPTLRKEVDLFLSAERKVSQEFLESPEPFTEGISSTPRTRLGPYEIVAFIGAGGMGEVYRARDMRLDRTVAIKVLPFLSSPDPQRRKQFQREARAISLLQHPNICTFYELDHHAGADFLVMEFVEGLPIDQYCDSHRLTITERLNLFRQVCSAVQYAHQHLIIHRDIKPSNILVSTAGEPKLLDFGLAKILNPTVDEAQQQQTLTLQRALTPAYASPEQITGSTITTATDLYSLGVVFYELLTGRSPYRLSSHAPEEFMRAICEREPERPSHAVRQFENSTPNSEALATSEIAVRRQSTPEKLSKMLAGDLDNIIFVALRKEPQRRYSSVEQFAQDIQRHLDSLPVTARKDTFRYRTSTFVRRHKLGVAAATVIGFTLLTALIVTVHATRIARQQAQIARTERARAERRFNDVRRVANSLIFDLPGPIHQLPGATTVEKMLYDNGLKYLDSIAADAEGDLSLQRELATGYKGLGDSQGFPYGSSLGDFAGALVSYRKCLQMRQKLVSTDPSNIPDQIDLAKTYRTIGALLFKTGDVSGAKESTHKALQIIQPIVEAHGDNAKALHEFGNVLLTVGSVDGQGLADGYEGRPSVSLKYHLDSIDVFRKLQQKQPDVLLWQQSIAFLEVLISGDYLQDAKVDPAMRHAQEALQILNRLDKIADTATKSTLAGQKAAAHSKIGDTFLFGGHWQEAASEYRTELALYKELYDVRDQGARGNLADGYINLGHAESLEGNLSAGLNSIRRGLDLLPTSTSLDPPADLDTAVASGNALIYQGEIQERLGDENRALHSYQRAVSMFDSPALANRHMLHALTATADAKAADALAALGYDKKAGDAYQKALTILKIQSDSELTAQSQYTLLAIYAGLGDLESSSTQRAGKAATVGSHDCEWYEKSLGLWQKLPIRNSISPNGFKVPEFHTVSNKLARCQQVRGSLSSFGSDGSGYNKRLAGQGRQE